MAFRYLNISQMAEMFGLSRDTIRARLRAGKISPTGKERNAPLYDMTKAAPVIFAAKCEVCDGRVS